MDELKKMRKIFQEEKKGKELFVFIILEAENKLVASSPYEFFKVFENFYSSEDKIIFSSISNKNIEPQQKDDYHDNFDEIDDIDQLMNMVSTEDVNSNSKINSNLFISKYKNIEKLFSKFLSQKENENFTSFIEREYEINNEIFLLDNDEIFQTIHSESQVEDFKFEYFFGKFTTQKKPNLPIFYN